MIDAGLARELTRDLAPSYVVPMHFRQKDLTFSLRELKTFLPESPWNSVKSWN